MPASVTALKLAEMALKPIGLDILFPLTEARRGWCICAPTTRSDGCSRWACEEELAAVHRVLGPGMAGDRKSWLEREGQTPLELLQPGELAILEELINSLPV